MAKSKQSGQLIWRKDGWSGRYRTGVDGETIRVCVPLGTTNKAVARVKLDRLLKGTAAKETVKTEAETFEQAARRIIPSQGLKTTVDRTRRLEMYAFEKLGHRPVNGLKAADIRDVLEGAVATGLAKMTVMHLLNDISSILNVLWQYEILPENPARRVKVPKNAKVDGRPRVILTNDEFAQFMAWPELDLELRTLALTARCFGGMRTSDLHAWDWNHVDTRNWVDAYVPRPKTKTKDRLGLPAMILPQLQAWWTVAGCPSEGLVFPKWRRGGVGGQRGEASHARRLRKALWKAGVRRGPTIETCALQTDNGDTRRVDFHSFRRAFNTALASAGVNVQMAMKLAGHRNTATHMRYVLLTETLQMPLLALPNLTRAPFVPILTEMSPLTISNYVANGEAASAAQRRQTDTNQLDSFSYYESVRLGANQSDPTVPNARAQAADAALSAYLREFATATADLLLSRGQS